MNIAKTIVLASVLVVCLAGTVAQGDLVIDTVPVGNPGNAGESSGGGSAGPIRTCGAVPYDYQIGKFEVTAAQYAAFLNAVATTDTYGLYNAAMQWPDVYLGCNILRNGYPGSYTYSVAADWANRPVNYVSWGDAARFCNWMHNGQPTGAQHLTTTEDGSYLLDGATSDAALMSVTRTPNATWVIPTEDEWYKAAYHKNDGVTGNYWDSPTGTNAIPNNGNPEGDTGNTVNMLDSGGYAIGEPYFRTEAGFYAFSESPYGTFDQGGNVYEWVETPVASVRGLRGGSYGHDYFMVRALQRYGREPTSEFGWIGFRVGSIPEPTALALLAFAGLAMLRRR